MTADAPLLLHIATAAPWRMALDAGSVVPPSLVYGEFVHLSTPDQVALPANRLYAGRDDLLLLVVDPSRLADEVRWEPGVPTDPSSMRFPHLYGPLPVAAVTSVVPWAPGPDGQFSEPVGLPQPADLEARARGFDPSLARRRAAAVVPVTGGFAAVDPRFGHSWEHNSCVVTGPVPLAVIEADADRALGGAGCTHRRVVVDDPTVAAALATAGWTVTEERVMVLPAGEPGSPVAPSRVRTVTSEAMHDLWRAGWRRDLAGAGDEVVTQLLERETLADAVVRVVNLASFDDGGRIVAGAQLRIDGATAAVEAVMTEPTARGLGHGSELLHAAVGRARDAGCDLVWLIAVADDWPRHWYERLGFVDVGARWSGVRPSR